MGAAFGGVQRKSFRPAFVAALAILAVSAHANTILDIPTNTCGAISGSQVGCNLLASITGPTSSGLVLIGVETGVGAFAIWGPGGSLGDPSTYLAEFEFPDDGMENGSANQVDWVYGTFTTVAYGGQQIGTGSFGGVDGYIGSTSALTIYVTEGIGPSDSDDCGGCYVYAGTLDYPEGTIPTSATPEPASLMMIGGGLIALGIVARRRRHQ